jgi:hypothetical protein
MNSREAAVSPRKNPPAQFNLSSLPVTPTVPEVSLLLDPAYRPPYAKTSAPNNFEQNEAQGGPPQTNFAAGHDLVYRPLDQPVIRNGVVSSPGFNSPDVHSRAATYLPPKSSFPNFNAALPMSATENVFPTPLNTLKNTNNFENLNATQYRSPPVLSPDSGFRLQSQLENALEKKMLEQRVKELEEDNKNLREKLVRLESQQDSLQQVKMDALSQQTAACLRLLENLNTKKIQFEKSTQTDQQAQNFNAAQDDNAVRRDQIQQLQYLQEAIMQQQASAEQQQNINVQGQANPEDFYNNALVAMQGLYPQRDLKVSVQETTVDHGGATRKNLVMFDTCYLPRVQPVPMENSHRVSDVSAHMNQLAAKLLGPGQQAEALQAPQARTYYNNLSMSTKQFLEKMNISPGREGKIAEEDEVVEVERRTPSAVSDKILDITAIKKQNKLL